MKTYYSVWKFDFGNNIIKVVSENVDEDILNAAKEKQKQIFTDVVSGKYSMLTMFCHVEQRQYFIPKEMLMKCVMSYTWEENREVD